jgi:transmembrane sensor
MTRHSVHLEAAEWHAKLKSSAEGAAQCDQFERWLTADPAHRQAFSQVEQEWRNLDRLSCFLGPTQYASSDEALLAVRQYSARMDAERASRERRHRMNMRVAFGAVAAVVATMISLFWLGHANPTPYAQYTSTDRPVPARLEDGSLMYLNSNSHVSVRFTAALREVVLVEGEVFFDVRHERREFEVFVAKSVVRATGTQFVVRKEGNQQVDTAVLRGSVEIRSPQCDCEPKLLKLEAGHSATVKANQLRQSERSAAEVTRNFAWTKTLQLDGTLVEAVSMFNLHNDIQLVIGDPDLSSLPVAGFYDWSRPQAFAASLHDQGVSYRQIQSDRPGKTVIQLNRTP